MDLDDIRRVVAELPGSVEGTWYGAPAFRVSGRVFARVDVDDDDLLVVRSGRLYRDALIAGGSEAFGLTDHLPERETSVVIRLSAIKTKRSGDVRDVIAEAWQIARDGRLSKSGRERI